MFLYEHIIRLIIYIIILYILLSNLTRLRVLHRRNHLAANLPKYNHKKVDLTNTILGFLIIA